MVDAPLRVVFFGTPEFALPTLDALLASRHTVVAVVCQPDRPHGRGHKTSPGPVKSRALGVSIPVLQPERLKDEGFLASLAALRADLGVVAAYGKILTDAVLAAPRLGMINVHASLLPRYRGAAPVHRAIIAGEQETGVTIMRVVKALDAGPMLATVRRPIGPDETSDEVERDLARIGAPLLVQTADGLADGGISEMPQDDLAATYAHRLTKNDSPLDWSWPATHIHNVVRGLHPWPHASTFLHGRRLIVRRTSTSSEPAGAVPGTVVDASAGAFVVAAGEGRVQLSEVQAEGKRPMSAREFLAGHRVAPGDRFALTP
jgi:methionyl-tRNA formyltransferase